MQDFAASTAATQEEIGLDIAVCFEVRSVWSWSACLIKRSERWSVPGVTSDSAAGRTT